MTQTFKTLIPLAIVFAFLIATNFIYAAWSAPAGAPSAVNNAPAPINVGPVDQVKNAALGVDGLAVFGTAVVQTQVNAPQYCDENGANCFTAASSTSTGVGTTTITVAGQCFTPKLAKLCNWNWAGSGNDTYLEYDGSCSAPRIETGSVMVLAPCEWYVWQVASWGACYVTGADACQTFYAQDAVYQCIDKYTNAVVADALCPTPKPSQTQACAPVDNGNCGGGI